MKYFLDLRFSLCNIFTMNIKDTESKNLVEVVRGFAAQHSALQTKLRSEEKKTEKIRALLKEHWPDDLLLREDCEKPGSTPYVVKCQHSHGWFVVSLNSLNQCIKRKISPCPRCRNKEQKGDEHWESGRPKFHLFCNRLTPEEAPQSDPEGYLTVLCKFCKQRFEPEYSAAYRRALVVQGAPSVKGDQNLYCSDQCKDDCDIFGKNPIMHGHPTHRPKNYGFKPSKEFRQRMWDRDRGCVKCHDSIAGPWELHHIIPKSVDASLVYDEDNIITLCIECHREAHRTESYCGYGALAKRNGALVTLEDIL
jgi:hypothetical protein